MWGENLLCHVCCGPQHEKQSGVREMVLVQKHHVTTWQVKPCPFVLQTSLTQVVFSWSNTLDVFPPTILPFLPPMFSCCVPCYHDYVLWDKWSPHLCYFYMSFNNCFSRWASLYWWLSYISSIYTYMIFFSMNMFVPAISHRYMYFIITMHLLNDLWQQLLFVCSCSKQAQVSAITHLQGINIKHQQGIKYVFTL